MDAQLDVELDVELDAQFDAQLHVQLDAQLDVQFDVQVCVQLDIQKAIFLADDLHCSSCSRIRGILDKRPWQMLKSDGNQCIIYKGRTPCVIVATC